MRSKQLAILSLIVMALVSTPRAMQQLRRSVAEAQERAGLAWLNLLLTPKADAAAMALAENHCPKTGAARVTTYADALTGRSSAWPTAAPARQQKADARKSPRQAAPDQPETLTPSAVASPELVSNNHAGESSLSSLAPTAFVTPPVAEDGARTFPVAEQLPSQVAAGQTERARREASAASVKAQRAVAVLEALRVSDVPANVRVVADMDASEFGPSPAAMNALLETLGKKGGNFQFRVRRGPEKSTPPRPRGRLLVSRDSNLFTFPQSSANAEHQGI